MPWDANNIAQLFKSIQALDANFAANITHQKSPSVHVERRARSEIPPAAEKDEVLLVPSSLQERRYRSKIFNSWVITKGPRKCV